MKMSPKELNFTGEFVVPNKTPYETWQHHINRYFFASKIVKGKTVLDVACGVGYGSSHLAKRGAKFVVGGDYSKDALEYAKTHYEKMNLEFIRLDARSLPLRNDCFDVIVSFETIEHLDNYRQFLSECNRTLKKGGSFPSFHLNSSMVGCPHLMCSAVFLSSVPKSRL